LSHPICQLTIIVMTIKLLSYANNNNNNNNNNYNYNYSTIIIILLMLLLLLLKLSSSLLQINNCCLYNSRVVKSAKSNLFFSSILTGRPLQTARHRAHAPLPCPAVTALRQLPRQIVPLHSNSSSKARALRHMSASPACDAISRD